MSDFQKKSKLFNASIRKEKIMQENVISKQFYVAFLGLTLGILSLISGGFGIIFLDKLLHLLIFMTVIFINFYMFNISKKRYLRKCVVLIFFISIYSILINPYLLISGLIIQTLILLVPDSIVIPVPTIYEDSPLIYGIRKIVLWKKLICVVYAFFLVIVK